MKTQIEMFYDSHREIARGNLLKNLELAIANRRTAVQAWRDAGSNEEQWEAFTSDADVLVDIAASLHRHGCRGSR